MSTDIAKREQALPAHLTEEQKKLIATTVAPKANENELALFFNVCNRTGLDPFRNQIYLVERYDANAGGNVHRAQVGIDGARLVAKRTGRYRPGSSFYYDAEGKEYSVWIKPELPTAARVTVFVDDHEAPGYAVNYSESVQLKQNGEPRSNWKKMPAIMLRKCAEMATLRQAFPQELGGIYLEDEGDAPITVETEISEELATDEQLAAIADGLASWMAGSQDKRDQLDDRLRELYPEVGAEVTITKLTRRHADELIDKLNQHEEATA